MSFLWGEERITVPAPRVAALPCKFLSFHEDGLRLVCSCARLLRLCPQLFCPGPNGHQPISARRLEPEPSAGAGPALAQGFPRNSLLRRECAFKSSCDRIFRSIILPPQKIGCEPSGIPFRLVVKLRQTLIEFLCQRRHDGLWYLKATRFQLEEFEHSKATDIGKALVKIFFVSHIPVSNFGWTNRKRWHRAREPTHAQPTFQRHTTKPQTPRFSSHTSLFWTLPEQLSILHYACVPTHPEPTSQNTLQTSDPNFFISHIPVLNFTGTDCHVTPRIWANPSCTNVPRYNINDQWLTSQDTPLRISMFTV